MSAPQLTIIQKSGLGNTAEQKEEKNTPSLTSLMTSCTAHLQVPTKKGPNFSFQLNQIALDIAAETEVFWQVKDKSIVLPWIFFQMLAWQPDCMRLKPHVNRSAGQPVPHGTWYSAMFLIPGTHEQEQSCPRSGKGKKILEEQTTFLDPYSTTQPSQELCSYGSA
jgi:hypothetical protein